MIEVTTQAQLNKALKKTNGGTDELVVCLGGGHFVLPPGSKVRGRENCSIEGWGNCSIVGWENCSIVGRGDLTAILPLLCGEGKPELDDALIQQVRARFNPTRAYPCPDCTGKQPPAEPQEKPGREFPQEVGIERAMRRGREVDFYYRSAERAKSGYPVYAGADLRLYVLAAEPQGDVVEKVAEALWNEREYREPTGDEPEGWCPPGHDVHQEPPREPFLWEQMVAEGKFEGDQEETRAEARAVTAAITPLLALEVKERLEGVQDQLEVEAKDEARMNNVSLSMAKAEGVAEALAALDRENADD